VAAVITSLGALRETTTFPASAAGYQALLAWAGTFGVLRRAGVECTGLLRCRTGPAPASGRPRGNRGQPARQGYPPPAGQGHCQLGIRADQFGSCYRSQ
jgi:hypothetical protein